MADPPLCGSYLQSSRRIFFFFYGFVFFSRIEPLGFLNGWKLSLTGRGDVHVLLCILNGGHLSRASSRHSTASKHD